MLPEDMNPLESEPRPLAPRDPADPTYDALMETWSVRAANLPEHAANPIHTDAGGRAAGFPGALVAGVTTYAYLTHPVLDSWGLDWVAAGTAHVRFRSPVFAGDLLVATPRLDNADQLVEAKVDGATRASMVVTRGMVELPVVRQGEQVREYSLVLDGEYGSQYASRAGDDLDVCSRQGIVHPAVWPALANHVVHRELAQGSWIHTRSIVRHHALAHEGATARIRSVVVERFTRTGERVIVDVTIDVSGHVVATLEHEAIVRIERH